MENVNFPKSNYNIFFPGGFVVKKGDTLYSIAKALGVTVKEIKEANGMKNNNLKEGQTLIIPGRQTSFIFGFPEKSPQNKEFLLFRNPDDETLVPKKTNKFVQKRKNKDYKVQNGDTAEKIAKNFSVMMSTLLEINGLKSNSLLNVGKTLKIPDTIIAKNVKTPSNVAEATGLSEDYINNLIKLEEFHTKVYTDKNGNRTIGVGHLISQEEKSKYLKKTLTKQEVYTLLAQDLINREQNIKSMIGEKAYAKMPQPLKDSVMDFVFNRGEKTVENHPGFINALKEGRYADAISKMTIDYTQQTVNGKKVKKHLSGLSKRRLYEIGHACKIYNGNIPKNILASAQHVYNQGMYLLKKEFPDKKDFENQKIGYNKEVKEIFGDKIKVL